MLTVLNKQTPINKKAANVNCAILLSEDLPRWTKKEINLKIANDAAVVRHLIEKQNIPQTILEHLTYQIDYGIAVVWGMHHSLPS